MYRESVYMCIFGHPCTPLITHNFSITSIQLQPPSTNPQVHPTAWHGILQESGAKQTGHGEQLFGRKEFVPEKS